MKRYLISYYNIKTGEPFVQGVYAKSQLEAIDKFDFLTRPHSNLRIMGVTELEKNVIKKLGDKL